MKQTLITIIALLSISGCSVNDTFVYKPSSPVAGVSKLPVKVAVLPFKDATEDFTKRGNELFDQDNLKYNLAKAGLSSTLTALTPELWAKALADDMAASGDFQSVHFFYNQSELKVEDFIIEGAVEKAYFSGTWDRPNEFALSLRALRRTDNRLTWEKAIVRTWKTPFPDCGPFSIQCMVDGIHTDINNVMQNIFAEARADLVRALAHLLGSKAEEDHIPSVAPSKPPLGPNSVDEEIESILKGN